MLPLLSSEETLRINVTFNATDAKYPDVPVLRIVEEHAFQHPLSTALVWETDGHIWTYEMLNRAANCVAKQLIRYATSIKVFIHHHFGLTFCTAMESLVTRALDLSSSDHR